VSVTAPLSRRSLRAALRETASNGFAHVEGVVEPASLRSLARELDGGPLRRMAGTFGTAGVRMEIDGFDLQAPFDGFPALFELAEAFRERVRRDGDGIRGLRTWAPNEAGAARYHPGSVGVTSHMDGRWYRRLVAVFTIAGSARFDVRGSREGDLLERWNAGAGSVTLMRGPGLAGVRDGRPYHAVHGPTRGVRWSLALRMRASAPGA
jgi:alkylated DNA repair dioxygenase AlkB